VIIMIVKRLINTKALCLLFFLLSVLSGSIHARENSVRWDMNVGVSLLNFGYKEFDDNGVLLDREDGIIPGVLISLERRKRNWGLVGSVSFNTGQVDYDGFSLDGINPPVPYKTRTNEDIVDTVLQVENLIRNSKNRKTILYTGIGYHYWARNIQAGVDDIGRPVSSGFEVYEWKLALIGIKGDVYQKERVRWGANFRISQLIKGL